MKKIIVTCALVLLVSCRHKMDITPTSGDSSPIIISDGGSVHLRQRDHFRVHSTKSASTKLGKHEPEKLWYRCDPDVANSCNAGNCNPTAQPYCGVKLKGLNTWSLDLFDDTGVKVATLGPDGTDSERIAVDLPQGFQVYDVTGGFVELVPSANHLKSATFNSGGTTITFACNQAEKCLTVGYKCASGCPAKP